MGENSKIEWTDHTWNPWIGCTRISPGCDHCYAATQAKFRGWVKQWGEPGQPGDYKRTSEANWKKPLQWARKAREARSEYDLLVKDCPEFGDNSLPPHRPRVFCASLADVFDNQVPSDWRDHLFHIINITPELDWLLLTKRPENIASMIVWGDAPPPNVWVGTTCEDQAAFDRRWPVLEKIPARVRFVSYEPAIGPLTMRRHRVKPDWLIAGGETGQGHRWAKALWFYSIKDECEEEAVPFFMKQMAGRKPIPEDLLVRQFPPG